MPDGLHTVRILAFDEHGANNGGPNQNPSMGGNYSLASASFYVGTPPSTAPTTSPAIPSPTTTISPSPTPRAHVSPFITSTPQASEKPAAGTEPQQDTLPNCEVYVAVFAVIVVVGIGIYSYSERPDKIVRTNRHARSD